MTRSEARELIVAEIGEPWAYSYFDRSMFIPGQHPRLHPWSYMAGERCRVQAKVLKRLGIGLGHTMEPGAWCLQMAAE